MLYIAARPQPTRCATDTFKYFFVTVTTINIYHILRLKRVLSFFVRTMLRFSILAIGSCVKTITLAFRIVSEVFVPMSKFNCIITRHQPHIVILIICSFLFIHPNELSVMKLIIRAIYIVLC